MGARVAHRSVVGRRASDALWALLWGSFAAYFLIPANRIPQGPHDLVAGMASGEPGWIRSLDNVVTRVLNGRGVEFSVVFAALCVAIALAIFIPSLIRVALAAVLVFAGVVWLTQDFGGILTSQGTDVNSGPLIALLAVAYWPLASRRHND